VIEEFFVRLNPYDVDVSDSRGHEARTAPAWSPPPVLPRPSRAPSRLGTARTQRLPQRRRARGAL